MGVFPCACQPLTVYAALTDGHGRVPLRLVLTDVLMPGIGGVDLVGRLLKRDPATRVLFMSGHVAGDFPEQVFGGRRFELLAKPFRPEGLLRAVRAALDRPPPRRTPPEGGPAAGRVVSTTR